MLPPAHRCHDASRRLAFAGNAEPDHVLGIMQRRQSRQEAHAQSSAHESDLGFPLHGLMGNARCYSHGRERRCEEGVIGGPG